MFGGYGVTLFGVWELPNPTGQNRTLASAAKWVHILASYGLLLAILGHVGLVLRHQFMLKDGLLKRMLP
jgi:cytochrome b561